MTPTVYDLLGVTSAAQTVYIAGANKYTVAVPIQGGERWLLQYTIAGTAGDGGDSCIPILQTSYDGGTTWKDLGSGASVAGGVVAAVTAFMEALTPKTSAALVASDGALAASTISSTALGFQARLKGNFSDADSNGRWSISAARLLVYG